MIDCKPRREVPRPVQRITRGRKSRRSSTLHLPGHQTGGGSSGRTGGGRPTSDRPHPDGNWNPRGRRRSRSPRPSRRVPGPLGDRRGRSASSCSEGFLSDKDTPLDSGTLPTYLATTPDHSFSDTRGAVRRGEGVTVSRQGRSKKHTHRSKDEDKSNTPNPPLAVGSRDPVGVVPVTKQLGKTGTDTGFRPPADPWTCSNGRRTGPGTRVKQ